MISCQVELILRQMSLMLSPTIPLNVTVPKEYNLQITNRASTNTIVFTEKDLPGFSSKLRNSTKQTQDASSLPFSQAAPRPQFQDRSRIGSTKVNKTKRSQAYYRKAIPSAWYSRNLVCSMLIIVFMVEKTAVSGRVKSEVNCLPVENEEYRRVMDQRTRQEMKPLRETQMLSGPASSHGGNVLYPGALGSSGSFNNFIVSIAIRCKEVLINISKKPTITQRTKGQDSKTARMPQNELMDLIMDCFKKFRYWPLKTLKAELKQPEAFLKETLEIMAQLVRQGPYAMTWQLKPDYIVDDLNVQDDRAPDAAFGLDGTSDAGEGGASEIEEEIIKMEDVISM